MSHMTCRAASEHSYYHALDLNVTTLFIFHELPRILLSSFIKMLTAADIQHKVPVLSEMSNMDCIVS